MTLRADLEAIEARVAAATKGEWLPGDAHKQYKLPLEGHVFCDGRLVANCHGHQDGHEQTRQENNDNARFIAHAHQDLPRLVQGLRLAITALDQTAKIVDRRYRHAATIAEQALAAIDAISEDKGGEK